MVYIHNGVLRGNKNEIWPFVATWYSIVYINHGFFIHSSVDRHLGSFHNLAIVESAAINIGVQVPLCISTPVSLG